MDNVNKHGIASLYERFIPQETRRLLELLDIRYVPKQGNRLSMAEIQLSVLKGMGGQCTTPEARIKLNDLIITNRGVTRYYVK